MIDLEGVHLALGETDVLSGVDCAVAEGEFLGLVGPNGAGKTTLLRTINGLLAPDAGTVRVDGEVVADMDAKAVSRRVATVPQETHLNFAFTVAQVVEMGRTPHRSRFDWADADDAVERAMARTEVDHLADRPVDQISGGERQRVLLARALAQEAPVLVLDEPTASLDVNHQVRVLELVADLVAEGRTVVAAIHDLDLAARYCDRLALLHDGTIAASGPPETVLDPAVVGPAFDTTVAVAEDPLTASPRVTALDDRPDRDAHVHVVGGGRPAARALGACWRSGFYVSVGPVPEGDVAATLAADLGATAVTAPAFESIDRATHESLADVLASADVAVVTTPDPGAVTAELLTAVDRRVDWTHGDAEGDVAGLAEALDQPVDADDREGVPVHGGAVVDAVLDEIAESASGDD